MEPTTRPSIGVSGLTAGVETAGAGPASQPGFYPLTVGNRWTYSRVIDLRLIPNGWEAPPPEHYESTIVRQIIGTTEFEGRTYMEEWSTDPGPFQTSNYYRQDASGLYERYRFIRASTGARVRNAFVNALAGIPPVERAAFELAARRLDARIAAVEAALGRGGAPVADLRFPGTATPNEVTLLRYPLGPKTRWVVLDDPYSPTFRETAGEETLDLPAGTLRGHRIQIFNRAPDVVVHVWYGRAGFLQLVAHLEYDVRDDVTGTLIGRYILDQREWLTELTLARPPDVAPLPPWVARPLK